MRHIALLIFTVVSLLFVASPALVAADYDPFGGSLCTGSNASSTVCQDKSKTGNPISGTNGLILKITNIVAYFAGAIAIIIVVVSGIKYITSGGDPSKVSSAKDGLVNAMIGIVVIVLAKTLIVFVIAKLYGS